MDDRTIAEGVRWVVSKADVLRALRAGEQGAGERLSAISPEQFEQGSFEQGWNARQTLAHVASMEALYRGMITLLTGRRSVDEDAPGPPSGVPAPDPEEDDEEGSVSFEFLFQTLIDERADATPAALLSEFRRHRRGLIRIVTETDEALLCRPLGSPEAPAESLAATVCQHVLHLDAHISQIVRSITV